MLRYFAFACSLMLLAPMVWGSRCEIWQDAQRITHARTQDEASFIYCFGYLHGRDRAWMMDHFRRVAHGETAEVYGFSHLKGDMMMKLLDLPRWADKLWASMGEDEKLTLETYTAGVNHGFRLNRQHSTKEFRRGHPYPKEWTPKDTLALLLLQSFDQTRKGFLSEWDEAKAKDKWGDKALSLFDLDGTPWDTTVLKKGEYAMTEEARTVEVTPKLQGEWWAEFPAVFGEASGSNNWVIAPQHSKYKKAMLANDPHLDLKTPMFWYWVHLEGPTTDVIGASLPGVPLIVSGTNRRVSWGLTNSYVNTADGVFLEEKEHAELESFRPLVWVKWWFLKLPIFFKTFERTKDGYPVLPLETKDPRKLVLKWSGFHLTGSDLASLRMIMRARSSDEINRFLMGVGVPSWNFVFSDIEGKIGHRVVGKIFKSAQKDGAGFKAGGLTKVREPQFLTPEEVPHVFNPKRGWIVTANNRHWPEDATFYGGRAYSAGFRATRIEELLTKEKQDLESMRAIQCDDLATDGRYLVPLMLRALTPVAESAEEKLWLNDLKSWNFKTTLDCTVCPIYRRTLDIAFEKLLVTEIGFWRLGLEENAEWLSVTQAAFKEAFKILQGKKWYDVHLNPFKHLSGVERWKYSPEIPTRGDKQTVDPGTSKWNSERNVFEHYSGASERLIVVMHDTPEVWLSLPGLNAHYDNREGKNPWQNWSECRQEKVEWPLKWEDKALEKVEVEI